MSKRQAPVVTTDAEIDAAIAQAKVYDQYRPKAVAATYKKNSDAVAIKLASGIEIVIPRKRSKGLRTRRRPNLPTCKSLRRVRDCVGKHSTWITTYRA